MVQLHHVRLRFTETIPLFPLQKNSLQLHGMRECAVIPRDWFNALTKNVCVCVTTENKTNHQNSVQILTCPNITNCVMNRASQLQ